MQRAETLEGFLGSHDQGRSAGYGSSDFIKKLQAQVLSPEVNATLATSADEVCHLSLKPQPYPQLEFLVKPLSRAFDIMMWHIHACARYLVVLSIEFSSKGFVWWKLVVLKR
jgi:hypothetical protein